MSLTEEDAVLGAHYIFTDTQARVYRVELIGRLNSFISNFPYSARIVKVINSQHACVRKVGDPVDLNLDELSCLPPLELLAECAE